MEKIEIEIDGITYIRKDSALQHDSETRIVILQRGWVYIGKFERDTATNICKLHNAYCIRKWGTTKGLTELVNGKTKDTILDKCDGIIEFDWLTVIHTISVNEKTWIL
jgi:hypothetical protein